MDIESKQIPDIALTLPESDHAVSTASSICSLDDAPDPNVDAK